MDLKLIEEIATANNIQLTDQLKQFALDIERSTLLNAQSLYALQAVTDEDTQHLDAQVGQLSSELIEKLNFNNDEEVQLQNLIAKGMVLGELYERKKWQEAGNSPNAVSKAIKDVVSERNRQKNEEFYSDAQDDSYVNNELTRASASYVNHVVGRSWIHLSKPSVYQSEIVPDLWPWSEQSWKPKSPRQDLVRATALLLADIDRLDRQELSSEDRKDILIIDPPPSQKC